jgi:hypothetical protein
VGRAGKTEPQGLRNSLARMIEWLEFKVSKKLTIDGLVILYDSDAGATVEALRLIKDHDPIRYARLLRDVERIWLRVIPTGAANFEPVTRTCNLDPRFLKSESVEMIASAIVHEATHARLFRCGIGYEEDVRDRVEAVCLRRQLAFAARLPESGQSREWAEAYLKQPYDVSDAAFAARHDVEHRAALSYLGVPTWIIGPLMSLSGWLNGRRGQRPGK